MDRAKEQSTYDEVKRSLDEMESLLEDKTRSLKPFWVAKKSVHTLLTTLSPGLKTRGVWDRYKDLTTKARSLAEFTGVETEFLLTQIDTCLVDFEQQWGQFEALCSRVEVKPLMPFLMGQEGYLNNYKDLYRQVTLLQPFIYRLPKLREELLGIGAPFSAKKRLLDRLTVLANQAFDKRHQLVDRGVAFLKEDIAKLEARASKLSDAEDEREGRLTFKLFKGVQFILKAFSLPGKFYKPFKAQLDAIWPALAEAKTKEQARHKEREQQRQEAREREEKAQAEREAKKAQQLAAFEADKKAFWQLVSEVEDALEKEGANKSLEEKLLELEAFSLGLQEELHLKRLQLACKSYEADQPSSIEVVIQEIKALLATLRKEIGTGSVDIEKGLLYQEHRAALEALLAQNKKRLETICKEVYE